MGHGRTPDFFLVGAPKSGTTSLHEMLRRHPRIFMPRLKEPRYLAEDMRPREGFEDGPRERGYPRTLQEYLALFDPAAPGQLVGEATTTYLWSRSAAGRIAQLRPDARIVAIFREPASFLRSLHLTFLKGRNEDVRDLRRAISLEMSRREGHHLPARSHRPQLLQYSEHVRYMEQLDRYRTHFPPERLLVLIYDDFLADNRGTLARVLSFLGADAEVPLNLVQTNVTSATVRSWRLKGLLHALSTGRGPVSGAAKATVKALSTRRLRRGAIGTVQRRLVTSAPPPADDSLMTELRRRFKPEVVALGEYLERDLVRLWGYDRLD